MSVSLASSLASLPEPERLATLAELSEVDFANLEYDWKFWGRPNQLEPEGDWLTWLALAGRGFGKTEAGAQWVRSRVANGARSIALVAETQKDLEEVMVPRLVSIHPPHQRPDVRFRPVRVTWPNGAIALGYNGTEPDQLRGPEFDTAWVDELAKYRKARETWDMLQFTMRAGDDPRVMVTTTPRNIPVIKEIIKDAGTYLTKGSTFDNAENLPESFLSKLRARYEGTRLGRQELEAEVLDDVQGALWTSDIIDKTHRKIGETQRIVVAVDPSGADGQGETADNIGIIVAAKMVDGSFAVLEDATCNLSPSGWGRRTIEKYEKHLADKIVAERNFGGEMVRSVIQQADPLANVHLVTASRGKTVRAEPIAALYEQGRVVHADGLEELEEQMKNMTLSGYVGEGSPDRVDALVWAITELMGGVKTVFSTPHEQIVVPNFSIPAFWRRSFAFEIQGDQTTVLWVAIDPADSVAYAYAEYDMKGMVPQAQAAAIAARGKWIPGVTAVTAPGRNEQQTRTALVELVNVGLDVQPGAQLTDTSISVAEDMLSTGRMKVFETLTGFERQYRTYHRDADGQVQDDGKLFMRCLRYWVTSGANSAITKPDGDSMIGHGAAADQRAGY